MLQDVIIAIVSLHLNILTQIDPGLKRMWVITFSDYLKIAKLALGFAGSKWLLSLELF